MPELPEVERAVKQIKRIGLNKIIESVETTEDNIVFSDTTHQDFASEITGRNIIGVKRYGKSFYLELDGQGKLPVLHFGMTGMLQVKGEKAMYYKEAPKSATTDWPPRFMKFILHLRDESTRETAEIAFMDARRLGRIRLRDSPATEAPISELGFDPILSMPTLEIFESLMVKRSCPIKALLLDQSFSAGVGNWVADEILYHSRVHPEQRCNTLTTTQVGELHRCTKFVCETAVSVDADDTKFPEDWLFKHRWGKGKKTKAEPLRLPSGQPATIQWVTVGGRTSAYVVELQQLANQAPAPSVKKRSTRLSSPDVHGDSESDLPVLTDSDLEVLPSSSRKRKKIDGTRTSHSKSQRFRKQNTN
ncbi:AtMMH-1 [Lentinula aciculospora]|uniref:AtMMH-1 n=1 Tax=Lentinula aciculospora TaxID=153920 RepID=A0A9W9DU42_9AGAR|nr:AtMMH-1 [Lentinula aciculospora]